MTRKGGRPPKPKTEKLSVMFSIRFTEPGFDKLCRDAKGHESISAFLKTRLPEYFVIPKP